MATDASLSYRDDADGEFTVGLDEADPHLVAAGRPWRVFRWRRGQAHFSGWYWSATMGRHVVYESRLELARLLLADRDLGVARIAAQPFRIAARVEGRVRRHVPDFLLLHADGSVSVVNVKPAAQLTEEKVAAALGWAGEVFAGRGWRHEVWSGTDPVVLSNVRFLAGFRIPERVDADLAARIRAEAAWPASIGQVVAARSEGAERVRPALLHLLWSGVVAADLSVPLSSATVLAGAA